jgi:uncharacterized protein YerC
MSGYWLAVIIKMSGSKPKLKVRTLDEMLKKISESSENDPEQFFSNLCTCLEI